MSVYQRHASGGDPQKLAEILDRVRRVEAKLTRMLEHTGVPTGGQLPVFNGGILSVPTPAVSLKACLAQLPNDWTTRVHVFCGEDFICQINPTQE